MTKVVEINVVLAFVICHLLAVDWHHRGPGFFRTNVKENKTCLSFEICLAIDVTGGFGASYAVGSYIWSKFSLTHLKMKNTHFLPKAIMD